MKEIEKMKENAKNLKEQWKKIIKKNERKWKKMKENERK